MPFLRNQLSVYAHRHIHQGSLLNLKLPENLVSSFDVPSISGVLGWTDTNNGKSEYEVYSYTNGGVLTLLGTTAVGATSYVDPTCKQNATVVYSVRAKKGLKISDPVIAANLVTPFCWKTNQSVLTAVVISQLNISAGKSVTVNWGDGTSQVLSGVNANITKNYASTGQYNISLTGDTDYITDFRHASQNKTYGYVTNWVLPSALNAFFQIQSTGLTGDITNWVLPSGLGSFNINSTVLTGNITNWILPNTLSTFYIYSTGLTGDITNWVLPNSMDSFQIHATSITGNISNWVLPSSLIGFSIFSTSLSGSLPQISAHATNAMDYKANSCRFTDSNVTVFRKAMTVFNASSQNVAFSTANINKLLKALADWYQNNAPTANCTFTLSGANMGIPTGGSSNADLTRLVGYYTAAGRTCTILVRTS